MDEENKDEILEEEDIQNEEIQDEEDESLDESQEEEGEEETVPLSTFLDMKKKYKTLKRSHSDLVDKTLDHDSKSFIESKKQKYIDLGYDEALAEELAKDLADLKSEARASKRSHFEESILDDIEDLKSDPLLKDIDLYADEIIDKIKSIKNKTGETLDVEDAYLLVSRKKTKTRSALRDQKINDTQAAIIRKKKAGTTGNTKVATSTSSTSKEQYKLDKDDLAALATLQKIQPDAKWDKKKYYESMKK